MFVRDTFLSSVDRLSARSILTGKTGTCLGVLASAAFIAVAFIIFLGPVIMYFRGDFIQGLFTASDSDELMLYSGCDFKVALFFYQKSTNKLINHVKLRELLSIKVLYSAPDKSNFYADALPCNPQYFSQMTDKPHQFNPEDCFIAPDGLGYNSKLQDGYLSVFGFKFEPICTNPFMCSSYQAARSQIAQQRYQFFNNNYFVLRFTTKQLDQKGSFYTKFNQMYSTQWDGQQTIMPVMWVDLQTQQYYLDNSVMPWVNNQTILLPTWRGVSNGKVRSGSALQSYGSFALLSVEAKKTISYRQYKKLDWILGMLGGGILALFLIFWVPCHFISFVKNRLQNCFSTVLVQSQKGSDPVQVPQFRFSWYLSQILPFKATCCSQQTKIIQQSQKLLDIADIIKKMKVTQKNLDQRKLKHEFETRKLIFDEEEQKKQFDEQQIKYQLKSEVLQKLQNDPQIPKIYKHHPPMLSICNLGNNKQSAAKYLEQMNGKNLYSTTEGPSFTDDEQSKCANNCKKFGRIIERFFKFFDVFAAKPNLIAPPNNFSVCGCLLTFLIIILAILTFALTLRNMGLVKTYYDDIYVPPSKQRIKMTTGTTFKSVICFSQAAFQRNLVKGSTRIVDSRFFQYRRSGTVETYQYFPTVSMLGQKDLYFDNMKNPLNADVNLTFCFRPQAGKDLQVFGDANSDQQAFVGFTLNPVCLGTADYCNDQVNTTNKNFFGFISNYTVNAYIQSAYYFPDVGKILQTPISLAFASTQSKLNFTKSVQTTAYLSTLQLIDDWKSWILGPFPQPKQQILSGDLSTGQVRSRSVMTRIPHVQFRFTNSGRVKRVIFSSYKIDFLFAIIGGCFMFYYFLFACFGKAYNQYKVKSKLAQILYGEKPKCSSGLTQVLRLRILKSPAIKKIQNDLDATNLAKNVDNVYHLSATPYDTVLQRNLALIYMKQGVKSTDGVVVQQPEQEQPHQQGSDMSFYSESQQLQDLKKINKKNSETEEINFEDSIQLQKQKANPKSRQESTAEVVPTVRTVQKCGTPINSLDIFHTNSQLTLQGNRSVKSIFGGLFCIAMIIFICFLTAHFLTVYFSDFNRVSQQKIIDQSLQKRQMQFKVGDNFKLALAFIKPDDFQIADVSSLTNEVGISVVKYRIQRISQTQKKTTKQTIDLQKCPTNYLQGFYSQSIDASKIFKNFQYAYCTPNQTILNLYGSTDDNIRQYFALRVYNKYKDTDQSVAGNQKVIDLFTRNTPRYFMTTSYFDHRLQGQLRYETLARSRYGNYIPNSSVTLNNTITKSYINFDTAVIPSNQRQPVQTYEIGQQSLFYSNLITKDSDRYFQVNFYPQEIYNLYTVKRIKANQIFGIIGGCIAMLFLGFGCLPRSYNQFKMRYTIGSKLYSLKTKQKVQQKQKTKLNSTFQLYLEQQLSGPQLFLAWILSYWAFITNNYQFCGLMKKYSLIQSRATRDMNIYIFMKNLYAYQNAINSIGNIGRLGINLCRVFPKKIVSTQEKQYESSKRQFKNDVQKHKDLVEACKINGFTQWELHNIFLAKQKNVKVDHIFKQKWLDKFFSLHRSSYSSITQSQLNENQSDDRKSSQGKRRRKSNRSKHQNRSSINSASSLKDEDHI